MLRTWRLLAPALAAGMLTAATTVPAQAATVIAPPTITAPLGGLGPYPVGVPVTFTFSPGTVGTPVAYEYTLNGGTTQTVSAPSGTASAAITPTRQTSFLVAYAVAADGTVSGGTTDIFKARSATPAADEDMNGDGLPDLVTVGGTTGLSSGLWLAPGPAKNLSAAHKGLVSVPATNIGVNGAGFNPGAQTPADFDGAQVITGLFTGDGFQDVLLYFPAGIRAGAGAVIAGSGDGSALQSQISGNGDFISSGTFTDINGDNPLQVVNAHTDINDSGLPDLLATSGDPVHGYYLDYYSAFEPGLYNWEFSVRTPTPDGTADWNDWTLATASESGGNDMFLWNKSSGALYLWAGLTVTNNGDETGTLGYTQYHISAGWNKGVALSTLEAADFNGDGVPDLWTVTPAGQARAYQISNLSATGLATVTAGHKQNLS